MSKNKARYRSDLRIVATRRDETWGENVVLHERAEAAFASFATKRGRNHQREGATQHPARRSLQQISERQDLHVRSPDRLCCNQRVREQLKPEFNMHRHLGPQACECSLLVTLLCPRLWRRVSLNELYLRTVASWHENDLQARCRRKSRTCCCGSPLRTISVATSSCPFNGRTPMTEVERWCAKISG